MNVLVLSSSDKVYAAVTQLLRLLGGHKAFRATTPRQAKVLAGQMDIGAAVVHADGADAEYRDICLRLAEDCVGTVFVPYRGDGVDELYASGVFVAEKPITKATLFTAMRGALGVAYGYEKLRRENAKLKARLEELRIISRAKCMLASGGMTEEQAHREIERRAMNERRTKTDIAKEIIEGNTIE